MKLFKKILLETVKFLLFLLLMIGVVNEASEFIELKKGEQAHPVEGVLIEKEVVRGLFGSMSYFATVMFKDEVLDDSVELTKRQYEELTQSSPVPGILKKGEFHSGLDVKQETIKNIVMMVVFGSYPLFYILHQLGRWKRLEPFFRRHYKLGERISHILVIGGWFLMLLFFYSSMAKAVYNLKVTYSGDLVETEAIITDGYVEEAGRRTPPTYHLSFMYEDADGQIRYMTKQMLRSDYIQAAPTLTIRYPKDRPSYVSIPGHSWKDMVSLWQTAEVLYFALAMGMTGLTVYLIYFAIRKKKKEELQRLKRQQKRKKIRKKRRSRRK